MLKSASPVSGQDVRKKIFLEFSRDEEVLNLDDEFEKIKNRQRIIYLGNCKLIDNKLEKVGNFEINGPTVSFYLIFNIFTGNCGQVLRVRHSKRYSRSCI
jgi:hypothetical protein